MKMDISRRGFIGTLTGAAALSVLGLDRKALADTVPGDSMITDYVGRLCFNENPLGPSPAAEQAIIEQAEMAHRYPDWYAESLIDRIAIKHNVPTSKVVAGVGATEIIRFCAYSTCSSGNNVIVPTPSYGQYETDAQRNGAAVRYVSLVNHTVNLQGILNRVDSNTSAICITNPNNPTATLLSFNELSDFYDELPDQVTLVIDEAYLDYNPGETSAIDLVRDDKNVVVIKTFSKVYGLAGARIGYAVGKASIISAMGGLRMFAMISRPSLEAAKAALNDNQHVADTVALADETKAYCYNEFDRMGLDYIPSSASFFMVNVENGDYVRSQLSNYGIAVRTGWGMQQYIRVSTGLMEEMIDFIAALEEILSPLKNGGEIPKPRATELFGNYPNPFNSSTQIKVYMPRTDNAILEIFDINGRLVKTLNNGMLGSGEHTFTWSGVNSAGRSVSSGSYFYRLKSGGDTMTRRMMLVK